MSKLATLLFAVGALALAFVFVSPSSADAGWRRGWGGPGVSVRVGPRWGYYGPRRYYGAPYRRYGYYRGGYPYAYYPYWRNRAYRGWY